MHNLLCMKTPKNIVFMHQKQYFGREKILFRVHLCHGVWSASSARRIGCILGDNCQSTISTVAGQIHFKNKVLDTFLGVSFLSLFLISIFCLTRFIPCYFLVEKFLYYLQMISSNPRQIFPHKISKVPTEKIAPVSWVFPGSNKKLQPFYLEMQRDKWNRKDIHWMFAIIWIYQQIDADRIERRTAQGKRCR